jgi:HPt (histidine-containing phosphotransfer) domain-containing protein
VNGIDMTRSPVIAGEIHSSEAAIDWDHFGRQTMGDAELARDILTMFLDQSNELLRAVRDARSTFDRRDAAHLLKGSARAVGAFGVAEAASRIESLSGDAGEGPLLEAVARLHAAVAEARSAMAARLPGGHGPGL